MAYPDTPGFLSFVASSNIEISSSIDGIVRKGCQFLHRKINSEAFRYSAQIKQKWAVQSHGLLARIQQDISIGWPLTRRRPIRRFFSCKVMLVKSSFD